MNTSIYETLHSFVHHAVTPFFNAYINSTITDPNQAAMVNMGKQRDEKTLAQKKLAEFELSLLHLKQAVDIPDVHLAAHPAILSAIEMVSSSFIMFKSTVFVLLYFCRLIKKGSVRPLTMLVTWSRTILS